MKKKFLLEAPLLYYVIIINLNTRYEQQMYFNDNDNAALCYPPTFAMLPTIIFSKKYCRSSQRAQQEIQEQSSNTEEQELRAKHLIF